jgi:hypothetical protein
MKAPNDKGQMFFVSLWFIKKSMFNQVFLLRKLMLKTVQVTIDYSKDKGFDVPVLFL